MRAHLRGFVGSAVAVVLLAACSASPAATPIPSPSTSPAATPIPTPSPTPDVQAMVDDAIASLIAPEVAVGFTVSGTREMLGTTLDLSGSVTLVGSDMAMDELVMPLGIAAAEICSDGVVWLRTGDAHWVRDDMLPAPVPAFASAFGDDVAVGSWELIELDGREVIRAKLAGVDLDAFVASIGHADPDVSGVTGSLALLLAPDGTLVGFEVETTQPMPGGIVGTRDDAYVLAVTSLASAGDAGAPAIEPPEEFWIRHWSDSFGYAIHHPSSMTLATHEDREVLQGDPDLMLMVAGGMLAEGYDLDGIVAEDLARLRELGIKDITVTPTTIDGEPAQRLEMTVDQGGKTYWLVKTITVHGDAYYQLTWQDLAERRDAGAPVLEEMLASFRTVF